MAIKKPTTADMLEFFDTLGTTESILENSAPIYAAGYEPKMKEIQNIIRFNPSITTEQLNLELTKVNGLLEHINAAPNPNTLGPALMEMKRVIENRKCRDADTESYTAELMLISLENDLFDDHQSYSYRGDSILEGISLEAVAEMAYLLESKPLITPIGITRMANVIANIDDAVTDHDIRRQSMNQLGQKVCSVVKYECDKGGEYRDLPILQALDAAEKYLDKVYADSERVLGNIDMIFRHIDQMIQENCSVDIQRLQKINETEVPVPAATFNPNTSANGTMSTATPTKFSPNPFDVYKLTPFPTGTRTIQRSMIDIINAETDEEIEEALLVYGRLETMCEMLAVQEAGGKIAKGARTVSRKVASGTTKVTGKVSSTTKDVKVAAKKAVDPMARFIENSVAKFKAADEAQRREIILKGKTEGSIMKIWRWIKRGIPLIIIGQFGSIGAMLAGLAFITRILTDRYCDNKVRVKMLRELEDELAIVEEKIEDSKGDENKQAKYELMRIRNQLKSDIDKISLRLNY